MKLTICDSQLMVRRIAVACFVFAAVLAVPASAEAAEWLTIDGVKHQAGVPAAAENGAWKWDGKDALELNGYSGGVISAGGKLEITCVGENSLACSEGTDGILVVYNGEGGEASALTIKGPGSLSATTGGQVGAIQAEGDVIVSGANVKVESTEHEAAFGIISTHGKVRVENGSLIDIASRMNGLAAGTGIEIDGSKVIVKNSNTSGDEIKTSYGLQSAGPVAISSGSSVDIQVAARDVLGISSVCANSAAANPGVSISDSTVNISAVSSAERSQSVGIAAIGSNCSNPISIVRSTVDSKCPGGPALISYSMAQGGDEVSVAGSIELEGCEVVTPEGGYVCNQNSKLIFHEGDESEEMGMLAGQFIGTSNTEDAIAASDVDGAYAFEWPEPISNRVIIKPITAPEEPTVPPVVDGADNSTTPGAPGETRPSDTAGKPSASEQPAKTPASDKAKKSTGLTAGNLPATGDVSAILPVSVALAAGCAALFAGFILHRKSE